MFFSVPGHLSRDAMAEAASVFGALGPKGLTFVEGLGVDTPPFAQMVRALVSAFAMRHTCHLFRPITLSFTLALQRFFALLRCCFTRVPCNGTIVIHVD